MKIEEYSQLADRVSADLLVSYFQDVINDFENNKITKQSFLKILIQLTDRQVMTYELLRNDQRFNLDRMLTSLWNTDSYDEVDMILSIVVNLGLEQCYNTIKESIKNNNQISPEIMMEILETIEETGDHIKNPYYDLEKRSLKKSGMVH